MGMGILSLQLEASAHLQSNPRARSERRRPVFAYAFPNQPTPNPASVDDKASASNDFQQ